MITGKDLMVMVEKKSDEMDEGKKEMLSVDEVMGIGGRSDQAEPDLPGARRAVAHGAIRRHAARHEPISCS
jgi:hypothetical protein